MKKLVCVFLSLTLFLVALCGCGTTNNLDTEKKLSIVTTIFPEYDWVMNILGDKAKDTDVTMLLDSGVDLHSYQPTASDIIKISDCDVFIYVGGESDAWVKDALGGSVNKDMKVVNLLQVLGEAVKEEETVAGMEAEAEEEAEADKQEEAPEYDEHVWLSLKNAAVLCNEINKKLCEADAENKDIYTKNCEDYINKINELDNEYLSAVNSASKKTLLFGDRFPFRYLTDDYNLDYYAAFLGCSAESEASFDTIAFLAEKTDELGLNCVLTIEGTNHSIAQTIVSNTKDKNQKILSLSSMQSVTATDVKNGASYLDIMEKNLDVIKQALA